MNLLFYHLSQMGSVYSLSFSSQEILSEHVIGLDGIRKKLLVINRGENNKHPHFMIDLDEVTSCSVKKEYGSINAGDLKHGELEQHLQTMSLHFELNNNKPAIDLLFYKYTGRPVSQLFKIEQRARNWAIILSKMLKPVLRKIA